MANETPPVSDWIDFAAFDARQLRVADPMLFGDLPPAPTFDVVAGRYLAQVRISDYGTAKMANALRALLEGTTPRLGKQLDEASVDFGMLSIFDWPTYDKAMTGLTEEQYGTVSAQLESFRATFDTIKLPSEAAMPIVGNFGGDGGFPIFELLNDAGDLVGLQIDLAGEG